MSLLASDWVRLLFGAEQVVDRGFLRRFLKALESEEKHVTERLNELKLTINLSRTEQSSQGAENSGQARSNRSSATQGQAAVAMVTRLDAAGGEKKASEEEKHHGMRNRELLGGSGKDAATQ
ncbi:unnamed protein product [Pleuronectes platessa]|uniref:Uncharacterized protein n=1 Tax=Pleuronectes platessa TaxID=8262 RepID=A0A9N7V0V9_PLEPL|nr:unnamed protein product [Pleuronectes platessa]